MQNENEPTDASGGGGSAAAAAVTTSAATAGPVGARKVDPTQPPSPTLPHTYLHALLVGVDDYTAFASHGGADLAGSVADVALWRGIAQRMGAGSVDVRTSPDQGHGPATRSQIVAAFRTLIATLERGPAPQQGIFVFSGHGHRDVNGVKYVCPADTTPGGTNLLAVNDLLAEAGGLADAGASLTIVLDCCFSQITPTADARISGLRVRALRQIATPRGSAGARAKLDIPPGVTAVGAGDDTFEHYSPLGWIGSFTFAATNALDRWTPYGELAEKAGKDAVVDGAFYDVTYRQWFKATKAVLRALGLTGSPNARWKKGSADALAVFQWPHATPKPTFTNTTSSTRPIQLDPGADGLGFYAATVGGGQPVGSVVVVGPNPQPTQPPAHSWTPNSEYWDVDLPAMDGQPLTLTKVLVEPDKAHPTGASWRVDTSDSNTTLHSGTLPVGTLWKSQGAELPTFKIDRANGRTVWIRSAVVNVGTSAWGPRNAALVYSEAFRTIDKHLGYGT